MPNPQISPTRVIDGVRHVWDGSQWVIPSDAASPRAPMITMPPRTPSGRTDANDRESATWLLKNLLMTGGMIAGGTVGVPALLGGAALGRMAGHIPEALITSATGQPNSSSFVDEGITGAEQGLEGEMAGRVAGPILSGGGRVLKFIGKALGDDPAAEAYTRARVGGLRSWLGHSIGMPGWATAAAAAGPPMASEAGRGLEAAGEAIGSEGLSSRIRGAVDALKARTAAPPVLTHAEEMTQGAEGFAAGRRPAASFRPGTAAQTAGAERADVLSQAARGRASGLAPEEIGGTATVRIRTPEEHAIGFEPAPPEAAAGFYNNAELVHQMEGEYRKLVDAGMEEATAHRIIFERPFTDGVPLDLSLSPGALDQTFKKMEPWGAVNRPMFLDDLPGAAPAAPAVGGVNALIQRAVPAPVSAARGAANLADSFVADASAPTPGITVGARPARFQSIDVPDQAARNQAMRDTPPQDAVAELARRFGSKTEGEMAASRLFKGNLDNEFAPTADQVTVPETQLGDALTYLRNRLKK